SRCLPACFAQAALAAFYEADADIDKALRSKSGGAIGMFKQRSGETDDRRIERLLYKHNWDVNVCETQLARLDVPQGGGCCCSLLSESSLSSISERLRRTTGTGGLWTKPLRWQRAAWALSPASTSRSRRSNAWWGSWRG